MRNIGITKFLIIIFIANIIESLLAPQLINLYLSIPVTFLIFSFAIFRSSRKLNPLLAFSCGLYVDLMRTWKSKYGDRIYDLNYEQLISNQEKETRKLIKHINLSWENICLSPQKNKRSVRTASQQQVRKKVYQGSSKAWLKYEVFLNGAFDNLPSIQ